MAQVLYRKYRSKSLDEIVGQEHITKTLAQAIKSDRVAHAYLFTGPRGVGKTSIARILAHAINGIAYTDDSGHIDIIEIDAASNRKLEETKSLIEKVYVAPISARYKVYIIDEVHMLTSESFNALLKTLEEPPDHAVFILATTEAHKLPETIISRTQRFQFKPIEPNQVIDHLGQIAKQEGIKIDAAALELIAAHGQGSFRDSISLLDQAANYAQPVTPETIATLLGIPPQDRLDQVIDDLITAAAAELISNLHNLFEQGYPAPTIASQLAKRLREQVISGNLKLSATRSLDLLAALLAVPAAAEPDQLLEIVLLKARSAAPASELNPTTKPAIEPRSLPTSAAIAPTKQAAAKTAASPIKPDKKIATKPLDKAGWEAVLDLLRVQYNTLYGVVRMASVDFSDPALLKLKFAFPFHQKRVDESRNRQLIQDAIEKVTGSQIAIECVVDQTLLSKTKPGDEPLELETISSIFGGGELID